MRGAALPALAAVVIDTIRAEVEAWVNTPADEASDLDGPG